MEKKVDKEENEDEGLKECKLW